jgi:hypothetical protein
MWLHLQPGPQRDPAAVADVRAKLLERKAVADAAAGHLADPPVGVESVDRHRARAKVFVDARAKAFGLLLDMLAGDAAPTVAFWDDWGAARRTADAAWVDLTGR